MASTPAIGSFLIHDNAIKVAALLSYLLARLVHDCQRRHCSLHETIIILSSENVKFFI